MSRTVYRKHVTLSRALALFMLTVMLTFLVGKSVHTYIHTSHACEESAKGHSSDHKHHDCKICHFELSLFESAPEFRLSYNIGLASRLEEEYTTQQTAVTLFARSSRAPPSSVM